MSELYASGFSLLLSVLTILCYIVTLTISHIYMCILKTCLQCVCVQIISSGAEVTV